MLLHVHIRELLSTALLEAPPNVNTSDQEKWGANEGAKKSSGASMLSWPPRRNATVWNSFNEDIFNCNQNHGMKIRQSNVKSSCAFKTLDSSRIWIKRAKYEWINGYLPMLEVM